MTTLRRRASFRLFNALNRRVLGQRIPDRLYYWLWDRVGDGGGWRPLHMRHPEHFGGNR